jgi:hypothetical protein
MRPWTIGTTLVDLQAGQGGVRLVRLVLVFFRATVAISCVRTLAAHFE